MAENLQSWPQQRQGFRPGMAVPQRMSFPGHSQAGTVGSISSLSREERLEAKRLAEEANFSFEGYQVVRREFMSHMFDPAMTIRGNSITFNNACISKLEAATYIQFLINPTEHKLAIRPCDEGARDAVRWCVVKGDKRKSREISCRAFTEKLYALMGWEEVYRYKLQGMRINYQGENLYLFDLSSKEAFLPQKKDPETGKVRKAKAIHEKEWLDTFGLSVEEHSASTRVDLTDGFVAPEAAGTESGSEGQPADTEAMEGFE